MQNQGIHFFEPGKNWNSSDIEGFVEEKLTKAITKAQKGSQNGVIFCKKEGKVLFSNIEVANPIEKMVFVVNTLDGEMIVDPQTFTFFSNCKGKIIITCGRLIFLHGYSNMAAYFFNQIHIFIKGIYDEYMFCFDKNKGILPLELFEPRQEMDECDEIIDILELQIQDRSWLENLSMALRG